MFQLVVTVSVQAQKMEAATMAVRFALDLDLDLGLDPVVEMKVEILGNPCGGPGGPISLSSINPES